MPLYPAPTLQRGSTVGVTSTIGELTITWPVPFPTAPTSVILQNGDRNQGLFFTSLKGSSVTATQCVAVMEVFNTGAAVNTVTVRINWIAVL